MKMRTKIYLIIVGIILIITLAIIIWAYVSFNIPEFSFIVVLIIGCYIIGFKIYHRIRHPLPKPTPEEEGAFKRGYEEERGRIEAQMEYENYKHRRWAEEREARAEERWMREREKEMDEAFANFGWSDVRKKRKRKKKIV